MEYEVIHRAIVDAKSPRAAANKVARDLKLLGADTATYEVYPANQSLVALKIDLSGTGYTRVLARSRCGHGEAPTDDTLEDG
jgi:hypothetical protein